MDIACLMQTFVHRIQLSVLLLLHMHLHICTHTFARDACCYLGLEASSVQFGLMLEDGPCCLGGAQPNAGGEGPPQLGCACHCESLATLHARGGELLFDPQTSPLCSNTTCKNEAGCRDRRFNTMRAYRA